MATKTFDELIAGATQIKQNELPESNTHNLVGEQLIAMAGKQKEVDLQSDVINVTTKFPLATGSYYTQATARAAVTAEYRKLGKKLLYKISADTWIEEKFIGSATTDVIWNADANWQGVANKNDIVQIGADLNNFKLNPFIGDSGKAVHVVGLTTVATLNIKSGIKYILSVNLSKVADSTVYIRIYDSGGVEKMAIDVPVGTISSQSNVFIATQDYNNMSLKINGGNDLTVYWNLRPIVTTEDALSNDVRPISSGGVKNIIDNLSFNAKNVGYASLGSPRSEDFIYTGYINPLDGALNNAAGWKATGYYPIDGKNCRIISGYLESKNQYVAAIAFYSIADKAGYISCISNVLENNKVLTIDSSTAPTIPDNAKYVRFTTKDDTNINKVWADVLLLTTAELALNSKGSKDIATQAYNLAGLADARTDPDESFISQNKDWATGEYGYPKVAQYTRLLSSSFIFNKIIINGIKFTGSGCTYRIYKTNKGVGKTSEVPNGSPSNGALVKSGDIAPKSNDYADYEINLGSYSICESGYQIVIYLVSSDGKYIFHRGYIGTGIAGSDINRVLYATSPASDPWTQEWYSGGIEYLSVGLTLKKTSLFPTEQEVVDIATTVSTETSAQVAQQKVDDALSNNLQIQIPDVIYAVSGTEMNLYNDTIALSMDRGLDSPINYNVFWYGSIPSMIVTKSGVRFTPTDSQAGNQYTLSCMICNVAGVQYSSKNITIKVLAKNKLNAAKNIVYFGDSLGGGTATKLYENFNNVNKFAGVIPTMLGTQGTTNKYEAIGGYAWKSYATYGEVGYRAYVTGFGQYSIGSRWKDSVTGRTFELKEINVTEGTGNILLYKLYLGGSIPYGELTAPNGTLINYDNESLTFSYTDSYNESTNPLWNGDATTGYLDIATYKTNLGISQSDKIDAVSFQFGLNDHSLGRNTTQLISYISTLYNLFVNDNTNCKVIIGLTTTGGNTADGYGVNYGVGMNMQEFFNDVYKIRQFLLSLQNSGSYPNIRIAPINCELDRYYGYQLSTRAISQRDSNTEPYHVNAWHPDAIGYGQMGDAYFASYIAALTE